MNFEHLYYDPYLKYTHQRWLYGDNTQEEKNMSEIKKYRIYNTVTDWGFKYSDDLEVLVSYVQGIPGTTDHLVIQKRPEEPQWKKL